MIPRLAAKSGGAVTKNFWNFQKFRLTAGPKANMIDFLALKGLDESGQVNETLEKLGRFLIL